MGRRQARRLAFQMIYQIDVGNSNVEDVEMIWSEYLSAADRELNLRKEKNGTLDDEDEAFLKTLVRGVIDNKEEIDALLDNELKSWKIERVFSVDKNLLRLAVYEFLYLDEVPVKVTMNEAIEMAKKFGSEESPSFVNGVLANLKDVVKTTT